MEIAKDERLQYAWLAREEGYTGLEHEIIFKDICSGCGTCAAVCPEGVVEVGEFPKLVGKCTNCGYCLLQCPRSYFSRGEAEQLLFGSVSTDDLGHVRTKIGVAVKDGTIKDAAQDGGFVTALLKYALEQGIIDGAVVSGVDEKNPWTPIPRLVTTPDDLMAAAGTRYSNSANIAVLKEAKEKGIENLAVVGLPCQIEAVRKIQNYPIEDVDLKDRIKFTIAIFCTSNFTYDGLMIELVQNKYGVPLNEVTKMDIKGKNVLVFTKDKKVEIPLEEAYKQRREGCEICPDFTGRLSDFSAGAVGSGKGYSTVFTRTKLADELLKNAIDDGTFETAELKEEKPGLAIARFLQGKKEKGAIKKVRERIREELPLPFRDLKF